MARSKKSENPGYPDAHPTAPGGMSEKALVAELVNRHGWAEAEAKALRWPDKIDAVIIGRQSEEAAVSDDSDTDEVEDLIAEMFEGESVSVIEEVVHDAKAGLFIGLPGVKDYIFDGHRGAGPSAAERWMACTASLGAVRSFLETLTPNQQVEFARSNTAARQGTTAHAAAEVEARVVLGEVEPEEAEATLLELAIMPDDGDEAYDEEMAEYITEYLDLVKSFVDAGREVLIEERVEACIPLLTTDDDGDEETYTIAGSLDLGVVPTPEEPVLVVGDLKYGEGIDVDVEQNPQLRIYALGLLARIVAIYGELPDWLRKVDYYIVQPRLGGIKQYSETIDDLLDWQEDVLSVALTEALGGQTAGAAFNPGEVQCQWCPVRGSCPALAEQRIEAAAELFEAITEAEFDDGSGSFPETGTMSDERLGSLYAQITGLTKLAGEMKEELQRRLYRGQEVPGFHLVNYTPPRKWSEGAQDLIASGGVEGLTSQAADELFTYKLVTPTAAEKLLGEDYSTIEALVVKPDIRPVVAPVNDRRKPWTGRPPESMFEVE